MTAIIREYKNSLKAIEIEEILDLVFYRPLAFFFVKLIYKTNITPNQLTLAAMFIGLIGDVFFMFSSHVMMIFAGLFLIIYDVFDCADGQLARLKKNGTPVGRILDGIADYVVTIGAYLAIGTGLSQNAESIAQVWLLVVIAGASNAFHAISLDFYRNRFQDTVQERTVLTEGIEEFREEYNRLKTQPGNYFQKFVLGAYLRYSSIQNNVTYTEAKNQSLNANQRKSFYNANKKIMHLWTYLGPTTQLSFLIICAFLNRLDIYLWGLIIVGNSYALVLYFSQKQIDKKLKYTGI